ncbi:wax ester synthase/diacylglycerol acyltransferase 4-like [Euphorbia lathyris]|uniref:wax ester synthase/diacylglycerol acyltransferase 4-like n=1 Tax=Euphorbia lathyris TaxID=212925 RepID=UPI003314060B
MEIEEAEAVLEAVSPIGQYLSSSIVSLSIIAVLETEIPFDLSQTMSLVTDVFLPINPRFSSIMVVNSKGEKQWKKVEVNPKDHIKVPIFSTENSTKLYDDCLGEYISNISLENFPENKPLWEIHIINYPTKQAAGIIIFKLHHSLGDGFSLMGALLSCLKRADNPSIPLTFPSAQTHSNNSHRTRLKIVPKILSSMYYTISDLCSSIAISSGFVEDDISPIRSGHHGVEFLPTTSIAISFSLDSVKQIKTKLGVTINDVVTGTLFLGTRLYMEAMSKGSGKARARSLVLLNTRMFCGYKSVEEMVKPNAELPWGNHFTFLSVPIPKLNGSQSQDPLQFIWKVRKNIQRKRSSLSVFLTAKYLQMLRKFRGPEAVSKFLHGTLKYTSMGISNLMGPIEHMTLTNHPISGFYFLINGPPQSLKIGLVSYMDKLRVAAAIEKDFIDAQKFKFYSEKAFNIIFKAAIGTSSTQV